MAGILEGLHTPNNHRLDLDIGANVAAQQHTMNDQDTTEASLETTLLQPQEWVGPHATGNWLLTYWDQDGLSW